MLVLCAIPILWDVHAGAATQWMRIFHPSDIESWEDFSHFLGNLRVPIPIWLGVLEIAEYRWTQDLVVSVGWLYRVALVASYLLAIRVSASNSRVGLWLTSVLSVVYLLGTRIVHQGNPQSYDVVFPCLMLVYLVLVDRVAPGDLTARRASIQSGAAGVALSLAELTRPFALPMLLFLVPATVALLHRVRPRLALLFIAPIVVLSGGWHAIQFVRHDQILLSNHRGFNLIRGWPMVPRPPLVEEVHDAPLAPTRWPNLNTDEHGENSRRLEAAVVAYVVANPRRSAVHALRSTCAFLSVKTSIYEFDPESPVLPVYRLAVWAALPWLLFQAFRFLRGILYREWGRLIAPQSQLIAITCASIAVLAVGESGEAARFIVTLLPLLAALPLYGGVRRRDRHG